MRILVVDDQNENLIFLDTLLSGHNYDVLQASNGQIALDLLQTNDIDLIISDILMPVMDGYGLCQACKADDNLKQIKFIFYTATYTTKDDEEYAIQLGADRFLIKPMEPLKLLDEIEHVVKEVKKQKSDRDKDNLKNVELIEKHRDRLFYKLSQKVEELEHEIEERKKAEETIKNNLKEKEILLQELYHRTKNNMQVILSMLHIRTRQVTDPELKRILGDLDNKILCMAYAHQKLYESNDLSRLNIKEYVESLIDYLKKRCMKACTFIVEGEDIFVLIDTAIPCGFVVSELVVNAINHGFTDRESGRVHVQINRSDSNELIIRVADNGVGFPEGFEREKDFKLGLTYIADVVENQLHGTINYKNANGLVWEVIIQEEHYKQRV